MLEYNTQRKDVILKEYGRNIEGLIAQLKKVEDKEKRTEYAAALVKLMRLINPNINENPEYNQKLWDDLYIMSGFKIEVDSPFPIPDKETLNKPPQQVKYNVNRIKYKHYGRNIDLLVKKAIATEDEKEKKAFTVYLGRLMKSFYATWNKDVADEIIINHIKELSGNKLELKVEDLEKGYIEGLYQVKKQPTNISQKNKKGGGRKKQNNFGQKRRKRQ